jgi:3-hydroxy-9,10-secoandrosta-1,3,5(10)-triene-9,17-dione monooxygenase
MSTTPTHSIPVPEPELTADEIVQRARDMVPTLRARQAEAEELGRLPDETSREFIDAGFYRILQPRRFGGYEFDLPTFTRVAIELARGCPASGWT